MKARLVIALLLSGASLALPRAGHAHAFLDHADPRVGSTVRSPPAVVTLTFTEGVEAAFSRIEVLDGDGKPVVVGALEHPGGRRAPRCDAGPPSGYVPREMAGRLGRYPRDRRQLHLLRGSAMNTLQLLVAWADLLANHGSGRWLNLRRPGRGTATKGARCAALRGPAPRSGIDPRDLAERASHVPDLLDRRRDSSRRRLRDEVESLVGSACLDSRGDRLRPSVHIPALGVT